MRQALEQATSGDMRPMEIVGATIGRIDLSDLDLTRTVCIRQASLGELRGNKATRLSALIVEDSVVRGRVNFERTLFRGPASWRSTTFTRSVDFSGSRFEQEAVFSEAQFHAGATIDSVEFCGEALFGNTNFASDAWFRYARFRQDAWFAGVMCDGGLRLRGARFDRDLVCVGALVKNGIVGHDVEIFGDLILAHALILGGFRVVDANVRGRILSRYSLADSIDLTRTVFHDSNIGNWAAETVCMDAMVSTSRIRTTIVAATVSLREAKLPQGGEIALAAGAVDAFGAEFPEATFLVGASDFVVASIDDQVRGHELNTLGMESAVTGRVATVCNALRHVVEDPSYFKSSLSSLERADLKGLTVEGVSLAQCALTDAYHVDQLRIGPNVHFQYAPRPLSHRPVLGEEIRWRQGRRRLITGRLWSRLLPVSSTQGVPDVNEIGAVYRAIRKSLDETRNEAAAATFHYGEMEMRRASCSPRTPRDADRHWPGAEWLLLTMYWIVAGYGLRAWRPLSVLIVIMVGAAALLTDANFAYFTHHRVAIAVSLDSGSIRYGDSGPTGSVSFATAFAFLSRTVISLHANTSDEILTTTGLGTAVAVFVRVLAPILFALIVFSVRARTKR